jgi:protein-disulfide isomerase
MTARRAWMTGAIAGWMLAIASCNTAPTSAPAPAAPTPQAAAKLDDVAKRIEEYFSKSVSPGIALKANAITPSQVPGWNKGILDVDANGTKQAIPFLVSPDGKYFISGEVTDLTIDPLQAVLKKIDVKGRPARGPADAKVTIVEFSDFQCPFCSRGYQILEEQVMPEYQGKVRPLLQAPTLEEHPPLGEGARARRRMRRRSEPRRLLEDVPRALPGQRDLNQDNLKTRVTDYAKGAGLDEAKFTECFDGKTALPRVEKDLAEAAAVGAIPPRRSSSTAVVSRVLSRSRTSRPSSTKSSADDTVRRTIAAWQRPRSDARLTRIVTRW